MKALIRTVIALACSPLSWLREFFSPGVRILMYHRVDTLPVYDQLTVTPENFRQQLAILVRHYRVISLSQALVELAQGVVIRKTVVITFDDGYLDNAINAQPLLAECGLPATVFVTTGFADGKAQHPRYKTNDRLHMNWKEVRHWLDYPGNEVGAHSRSHPYLRRIDEKKCQDEIAGCMSDFAQEGVPHNGVFCYPSGDVSGREESFVSGSGYVAAVTVAPGVNRPRENRFLLRRTEMTDKDVGFHFRLKLMGAYDVLHTLLHIRRKKQFAKAAEKIALSREY